MNRPCKPACVRACRELIVNSSHEAPAGARQCPENSLPPREACLPTLQLHSSTAPCFPAASFLSSKPLHCRPALSGEGRRKSTDRPTDRRFHLPPPHLSPLLCPPQLLPFSPRLLNSHRTTPLLHSIGLPPPTCHSPSSAEHSQPYLVS